MFALQLSSKDLKSYLSHNSPLLHCQALPPLLFYVQYVANCMRTLYVLAITAQREWYTQNEISYSNINSRTVF